MGGKTEITTLRPSFDISSAEPRMKKGATRMGRASFSNPFVWTRPPLRIRGCVTPTLLNVYPCPRPVNRGTLGLERD